MTRYLAIAILTLVCSWLLLALVFIAMAVFDAIAEGVGL